MQIRPKIFYTPHVRVTAPHSKEVPGLALYEGGLGGDWDCYWDRGYTTPLDVL
jgi:hypothetical protein